MGNKLLSKTSSVWLYSTCSDLLRSYIYYMWQEMKWGLTRQSPHSTRLCQFAYTNSDCPQNRFSHNHLNTHSHTLPTHKTPTYVTFRLNHYYAQPFFRTYIFHSNSLNNQKTLKAKLNELNLIRFDRNGAPYIGLLVLKNDLPYIYLTHNHQSSHRHDLTTRNNWKHLTTIPRRDTDARLCKIIE